MEAPADLTGVASARDGGEVVEAAQAVVMAAGAMCACMSVLAAAVRAAICVLAQATAATAVLTALAGQ